MKKSIIFLVIFLACGGEALEEISSVQDTTSSTQISTTTSTSTSTTTSLPETTTSTVNIEDVILPVISFTNCPEKQISGDEFELSVKVEAGNYDLNYLRISQWKDEEYDGRIYYEKSNPNNEFPFPTAEKNIEFTVTLNDNDKNQIVTYEVFISASDESNAFIEVEERCKVIFNNIPATISTTTTSTTTVPKSLFPETPASSSWIRFSGSGDDMVDVSLIGDELQILYIEATGRYSFFAYSLDSNLENEKLITAKSDNVSDTYLINYTNYSDFINPKFIEITSSHNWEMVFKPIASARNFDGESINGSGDDVIEAYTLKDTNQIITVSYTGEYSFFMYSYDCNGRLLGLIVAESDSFEGNYKSEKNTCFLEITSEGDWSISK